MKLTLPVALTSVSAAALLIAACGGGGATTPSTTAPSPGANTKTTTAPAASSPASAASKTQSGSPQAAQTGSGKASGEPIPVGVFNDRSGATANVGTKLGPGYFDWVDLVNNTMGGVKGRPINPIEIDHKYEVPIAVDGYKKFVTRDNVAQILSYGTPITDALAPSANQDHIPLWTPGYGLSESADGEKFPYVFVGVASYQAQSAAIMDYVVQDWKAQGKTGNPKVIYSYYDNPAGRDPLTLWQNKAKEMGIDVIDTVAVPATTVDMTTIMTQIKDKNPDYNVTHYFGRMPALSLQAAAKVGFPREKMISHVWGISHDEIEVAQDAANGYRGIQFTALPDDNPEAYTLLKSYWQQSGKEVPAAANSVWYARGVTSADLMLQSMMLADDPTSGESVKKGAESLNNYTAHGMSKGTTITPQDHGGSRFVRMYEVKDGKLGMIKDWFEGPRIEHNLPGAPKTGG